MGEYEMQILQSVVLIIVALIVLKIIHKLISLVRKRFSYAKGRVKIVTKVISTIYAFIVIAILTLIWGIAPSQLATYIGSLLAVLGLAFIAQWSILSNITATLIIFFNHPVNIGDRIEILDKDYNVVGEISDMGIFFILIKVERGAYVSIPSNIFMQKMIKKTKVPRKSIGENPPNIP